MFRKVGGHCITITHNSTRLSNEPSLPHPPPSSAPHPPLPPPPPSLHANCFHTRQRCPPPTPFPSSLLSKLRCTMSMAMPCRCLMMPLLALGLAGMLPLAAPFSLVGSWSSKTALCNFTLGIKSEGACIRYSFCAAAHSNSVVELNGAWEYGFIAPCIPATRPALVC